MNIDSQTQATVFVKGLRKFLSNDAKYRLLREDEAILAKEGRSRRVGVAVLCTGWGVGQDYSAGLKPASEVRFTIPPEANFVDLESSHPLCKRTGRVELET